MSKGTKMQDNKTWLKEQIDKERVVYCKNCDIETTLSEHLQKYYASTQGKILCNSCVEVLHRKIVAQYTN